MRANVTLISSDVSGEPSWNPGYSVRLPVLRRRGGSQLSTDKATSADTRIFQRTQMHEDKGKTALERPLITY
jgi:hypothetical protein